MKAKLLSFLQSLDITQVLFWLILGKILIFSSANFAESLVLLGLIGLEGYKYYVTQFKLKPIAESVIKELAENRTKLTKIERDMAMASQPTKPPTQRVW